MPDVAAIETAVRTALARVVDPEIRKPITELDMLESVEAAVDGAVRVTIRLTIVGCPAASAIERDVREAAASAPGVTAVDVVVGVMTSAQRTALTERLQGGRRSMPFGPDSLTRVYAVTSGKGGVGKSTVTANLAVALAQRGLAVGLVDADVHGFSIPGLLGLMHDGRVAGPTRVGELMLPPVAYGVKVISIGMFLEGDTRGAAVSWRGPMLHRTISQFLTDVYFGDLDVLLLDLPPGTGDVAISIGQLLPHAEVLIVTTPQPAAADVAERSGALARQSGQRIVGVVENMSGLPQPDGSVLELFGSGGGAEVARRLTAAGDEVPLLASLPISVALRAGGDEGVPVVVGDPEDPAARAIDALAATLAARPRGLIGRRLPLAVG
ncbi:MULTISPECIES: Mrp/NBP35 family ATP-binding protein [unclassified Rathayibacter]|uniref:Mrp/NBP35 family ATP-binding protein n=1 Tax=unclassified Rathayibacter TaxID=2609250 RepID=UPI000CE89635|nr:MULTISPECIES: Mrp/NBP35 family ATP-binding protein [unclassified Rathayibacter]PPF41285.1 sodium:proton antiporter [Rathayibacter sp. AY1A2]PPG18568.1 sodium:proton antiporter [Rathayibacter sp. AY1C6]PPH84616.1 sodium:proton antiporter [Rathayibacter sp. AY1D5]PPI13430.1 sodium:proton antiporter [Rathayibacter sp. AY1D2]